ncbi:regulation of nuclear pre-mRNA domain-containing protein 2 [Cydia amplana]|uniref:regulation of nuclear pre-mRNA domain-containing protein 2 n=1 Tax=Cydia amplana TaxID=1869771 RepID=UPI002FE5546C
MGETEEFNTLTFEKKLLQLKDTQESIQGLSSWCLKQRAHHKKIVASWLNVLKRVKVEQRLTLFYLANDVIQYSKRKNYEFVESWGLNLQKATPLVREEKVRQKILRIFKIWEQRSVYDDEFLSDLTGLLSAGAVKKTDDEALDFQPQQLVNKIKQCAVLEADTDLRLKYIHESHLQLSDADALCAGLKETISEDKSNKEDVEKELNEGIGCVERYTQALQREIVAREALLALLASANQYYSTQRGEVKVVAYAYKNFGARVRALKRKLDELIPTLPTAAPSPPQRDEDVPSPGPDEDLDLPNAGDEDNDVSYNIDKTFNTSLSADGSLYNMGLSSFLNSDNPLALFNESPPSAPNVNSANKIEVINSRPSENQDFNINDFLKTLVPSENAANSDNNSVASGTMSQKSQDALPGLDLLSDGGNPPPPTSFYGSIPNNIVSEEPEPYRPEAPHWNNNSWNMVPTPVPVPLPVPVPVPVPVPAPLPALPVLAPGALPAPPPPPRAFAEAPASPPHKPNLVPENPVYPRPAPVPAPPCVLVDLCESPPHEPVIIPENPVYPRNIPQVKDIPAADVDHRGILPPPPPPPALPIMGHMEDVDHRLLPLPPPPMPVTTAPSRHPVQQDVDHRNLISLTHQAPRAAAPRQVAPPINLDQDYRVPPMVPPTDIVESVDMDLSEDEDQQGMFPSQPVNDRRNSFNNNKVLVGGDNGKQQHNLVRINSSSSDREHRDPGPQGPHGPHSAPARPMQNPFDNMPPDLKYNMPFQKYPQDYDDRNADYDNRNTDYDDRKTEESDAYEEDLRSRGIENPNMRNPSPPFEGFREDWNPPRFPNNRYPRNWTPRDARPRFSPQQFRARPPNRWPGPRPPRFW